ncbi:GTP cyclohydrolase I FolE2 [Herbaspirillum sp. LeCh32-8]|uniref:GTP cyclohydrolase FolE2 n=1 Tax=Herbaspirillum sp. LeCh32-8 TaxID=2821356 RepID=UPI001AE8406F|nr:GTP cyclohydrolase FolE2 [Herbaspirillum sp. LeCh32-8]MBP0600548.1 GTP cyclohydrolase I FolE2 [Herbaspirillum sp. LeCh32-8]
MTAVNAAAHSLPDVARNERASIALPLNSVGMRGIAAMLQLESGLRLPATAALAVDLPDAHTKGIHMSRLYRLLDQQMQEQTLSPRALTQLLGKMLDSHADCASRSARVELEFSLSMRRPALHTPGLEGWRSYPVSVYASLRDGRTRLWLSARVQYSSTCPCSAALSRQAIQDAFLDDFADRQEIAREQVLAWIERNASLATPHSQRSEATLCITVDPSADALPLHVLIDVAEAALGTPVQSAVKRADEQAFALRNGANLMYVEDAARRLRLALEARFGACSVEVSHFESLHAHDAVAAAFTPGWERPD